jgi:hypothetical protein
MESLMDMAKKGIMMVVFIKVIFLKALRMVKEHTFPKFRTKLIKENF